MTARLTIEYDGGAFKGWATQPGLRTVQGELGRALETVRREPTKLTVAGRTDAGVHAWGQVASHAGDPAPIRSLNALLPKDVTVLASEPAPEGFSARNHAISRTYCYRVWTRPGRPALLRGRVCHWTWPHDRALLERCAVDLVGEHDFEAFTLSKEPYASYRRTIARAHWYERSGGMLEFWLTGNSFTRRMVRTLVAFQLEIAAGRREIDEFTRMLAGADRSEVGAAAPPDGLYLAAVGYEPPLPGTLEFGQSPT